MESYTIKEDVKQGFDLLVSFKLKQYKPYGTKIVKVIETPVSTTSPKKEVTTTTKTSRPANSSPSPNKDTTYTAKSGDTLWSIAKKFYGNGEYYKVLFEENSNILINENALTSGQKLKLPSKKSAETTMKKIKNAAGKSSGFTQVDFSANSKAVKP
jgi:LysM repeat protein